MKRKIERVTSAAVAGLLAVNAGAVQAFAVETETPEEVSPVETPAASGETSAEIKTAASSDPVENEDGKQVSKVTVNPSVDENNTVTDQGTLDVTTTPGETTSQTTNNGSATSTTVINPNGSTTTTTTQPTVTTTTETSTTEISGTITNPAPSQPTEEEKQQVQDGVAAVVPTEENGGYDWSSFEQNIQSKYEGATVTEGTDKDGNKTHTVEFTQVSQETGKGLTQEELDTILASTGLTKNADGTYTNRAGASVTVTLGTNEGTETTTTVWSITVTEKTETGSQDVTVDTGVTDVTDIEVEGETLSAEEILSKLDSEEFQDAQITTDETTGRIAEIKAGSKTYTFTYEEVRTVELGDMSAEDILALLPEDGGYELNDDGEIVKDGHVLTFDETQEIFTEVKVSVTCVDSQGGESGPVYTDKDGVVLPTCPDLTDTQQVALNKAVAQLTAEYHLKEDGTALILESVKDNLYSYSAKLADGRTLTFTVSVTGDVAEVQKEELAEGVKSQTTYTANGSAVVTDGTLVWIGEKEVTDSSFITVENGEVKVGASVDDVIDQATGEKVTEVTTDANGKITGMTTTYTNAAGNTVTKVYAFTYDAALTDEDKAAILGEANKDAELTGLSKITWTVETTETKEVQNEAITTTNDSLKGQEVTITTGGTVTKNGDTYTYKGVTLKKGADGKWHGTSDDGEITYTLTESTQTTLSETEIKQLIAEKKAVPEGYTFSKLENGSAIYTNEAGVTVAVAYSDLSKTTVTVEAVENKSFAKTETEGGETAVIQAAANWVKEQLDALEDGESIEFEGLGEIKKGTTVEEIVTLITTQKAVNQNVDFAELGTQELIELLEALEKQSVANGNSYYSEDGKGTYQKWNGWYYETVRIPSSGKDGFHKKLGHLDLVSDGTVSKNDQQLDCVIMNDADHELKVMLNKTAEGVISGEGSEQAKLEQKINHDPQGFYQYERKGGTSQQDYLKRGSKFYKVTGTVAYGFVERYTEEASAQAKADEIGGVVVQVSDEYKVYQHTAALESYGYLGAENNACKNDYDLKLGNLTLIESTQKVTSVNQEVSLYSINLTKKITSSSEQKKLKLGDVTTTTPDSGTTTEQVGDKTTDSGSQITGKWTATKHISTSHTETVDGEQKTVYEYTGSDGREYTETIYYTETTESGSATGKQYNAAVSGEGTGTGTLTLDYSYQGAPTVGEASVVSRTQERTVLARYGSTATSSSSGNNISSTTTPPGGGGGGTTTPPGGGGGDDGETTIGDEDVPLAELPEEQSEETEIDDEDVPLAEEPEETEIDDDEVPLAEVPQTGDISTMWYAAALLSTLGMLGACVLTLLEKRRNS